jgi:8-oxo-dGTP pyrophosphatase MutT (NUDIX family)
MHRQDLLNLLNQYSTRFLEEAGYVARSRRLILQDEKIFDRAQPMHVTGSAWVVNPARDRVFMVHHGKLHQWFQPGGHADGDPDVLRVALKEASEESGVDLSHLRLLSEQIFDVDIHWVPTTETAPAHGHVDIRFLVEIDDSVPIPGSHESHEVAWIDLYDVSRYNNSRSTHRMIEKTRQLRNLMFERRSA